MDHEKDEMRETRVLRYMLRLCLKLEVCIATMEGKGRVMRSWRWRLLMTNQRSREETMVEALDRKISMKIMVEVEMHGK